MDKYPLHRTGATGYNGTGKGTQNVGCGAFSLPRSKGKEGEGEMSGGSHNYLCYTEMPDIIDRTADMEEMEKDLIELGYTDIAKDVRRLIEYCKSAQIRVGVLFEQLEDVFHDVEWYHSADIGKETLIKRLEAYRTPQNDEVRR
jgi:hypothetical protein